jgi:Xaa-Pro dipeptidase
VQAGLAGTTNDPTPPGAAAARPPGAGPPHPLGAADYERFRGRLRDALRGRQLDGALLLEMPSVIWATAFHHSPSERPIGLHLPTDGEPTLFVPLLEREHAEETAGVRVETYEEYPGEVPAAVWMCARIRDLQSPGARLGIDALDAGLWAAAREQLPHLRIDRAAADVRALKDDAELALVRAAARYADRCLDAILAGAGDVIAAGGSELDVLESGVGAARALQRAELGDRFGPAKTTVVGTVHSGPRAALPHGRTSDRRPRLGEVLIAGIGAAVGGYHAESGATFAIGAPNDDQRRCLRAAEACHDAAIAALVPGAACAAVNQAGLAQLRAAGLGDFIRHRVGHAMGVQGHEGPWLAPGDATPVAPTMVFSNEPGIYRPGVDGYRTIDSMIVTEHGVDLPSTFQTRVPWDARVIEPA